MIHSMAREVHPGLHEAGLMEGAVETEIPFLHQVYALLKGFKQFKGYFTKRKEANLSCQKA